MVFFAFPGQGSQAVGMGKTLYESSRAAKEIFGEIDEHLKQNLTKIIFSGPDEALTLTENAQPALFAVSAALLAVLEKEANYDYRTHIDYAAGHSLGEYSALYAAGVLTLADTAKLLKLRGQAMQKAAPAGIGAMAAILGASYELTEKITAECAGAEVCQIANDNSDGQIVISGHKNAVEKASANLKEAGAKRAIPLNVSAPFHCALMQPAAQVMAEAFEKINFSSPIFPILPNVTAAPEESAENLKQYLTEQVTGRVRWRETMKFCDENQVNTIIEVGSGKVLSGMFKRACPAAKIDNIETLDDIERFVKNI
jgi:[acyl-carrier-protein] S-malonyltransferase